VALMHCEPLARIAPNAPIIWKRWRIWI
jgi:hypothetical protein